MKRDYFLKRIHTITRLEMLHPFHLPQTPQPQSVCPPRQRHLFHPALLETVATRLFQILRLVLVSWCFLLPLCGCSKFQPAPSKTLRLATTTSTRDSGLLDALLPPFEKEQNVRVAVIAAGTGKALKLGEAGDVDVVMVHARAAELAFMENKHGIRREEFMYNVFELLGPSNDPAAVRDLSAPEALSKIAAKKQRFISRGDDSGTHKREKLFWNIVGERPDWPEYIETGQAMGETLTIADQMQGYVLTDRGTYLQFRNKIALVPLARQNPEMKNVYGVIVVNPAKHPAVNNHLASNLVDYLLAADTQKRIANFQIAEETLFYPLHLVPTE